MNHSHRLVRTAVAFATFIGLIVLPRVPAGATYPGANGRIAFDDYTTGQIYAINPDGSGLVQLTHVGDGDFTGDPDWSPDGTRIAFESTEGGHVRLWIMNADGSDPHMVADDRDAATDWVPVFTPDGSQLVYQRCLPRTCAIFSIGVDGTHRRAITPFQRPPFEVFDLDPAVSPNGERIAFARFAQNVTGVFAQIYVMRADGSHLHAITAPRLEAWAPGWSPDGRRITFTSNIRRGGRNAFVINADGTGLQKLTEDVLPYASTQATFAPAGDRLAFASDRRYSDLCCADLFEMMPNGAGQTLIDTGQLGVEDIAWGTAPPISAGPAFAAPAIPSAEAAARLAAKCRMLPKPLRSALPCP